MAGANNNIQLTGLDFDEIKSNLKTYLRNQDVLKDANYEGSVLSILLDVLAYNTHYNSHYLNMVANEMFLDTAVKRASVISHAKTIGYLPQSYSAPTAVITLNFYGVTADQIIIPKYTKFLTETIDGVNYPFVSMDEYIVRTGDDNIASLSGIEIKQGEPLNYSFVYNSQNNEKTTFKIPDKNIDLSTLKIVVQKSTIDLTSSVYKYPDDMLALNPSSEIYFVQETFDGYYEVYFGDGVLGKQLEDGNVIFVSYLSVGQTVVQNVSGFTLVSGSIGDYGSVEIIADVPSMGGRVKESINSIKYIAPKAYQAQERAVTINDYITLIQKNSTSFPIESVNVWSGEENTPPVYGRIFVAVKPIGGYTITQNQKNRLIEDIIKPMSVMTVHPVVVDVDYNYLNINTTVLYDKNKTLLSFDQLKTQIIAAIRTFGDASLNTFNSTLYLSELMSAVNSVSPAILTNESDFQLEKRFTPTLRTEQTYTFDFGVPIKRDLSRKSVQISPSIQVIDTNALNVLREEVFIEEVPTSATSVDRIELITPGYGYDSIPTITINGDGTGANASAIIVDGKVERIILNNAGTNYTQATIEITGGGGMLASAKVVLQNQFGTLRSYYFKNGTKIILNENVGIVDYYNGIVTLSDFNPYGVNNTLGLLKLYVSPDTSILYSKYNKMLTLDRNDSNAIKVTLKTK